MKDKLTYHRGWKFRFGHPARYRRVADTVVPTADKDITIIQLYTPQQDPNTSSGHCAGAYDFYFTKRAEVVRIMKKIIDKEIREFPHIHKEN